MIGVVTDDCLDRDGQIVDKGWATERLSDWFASAANVRQMHSGSYPPAGKGKDLKWAQGRPVLRSKIVEPTAIKLLDEEVYTGYSVGIFDPCIYFDGTAPNGRIGKAGPEDTGWIGEVSLVDLPSCPVAVYSLVKRASSTSPAELVQRLELHDADGHVVGMTPKRMKSLTKAFNLGGKDAFTATLRKIVEADQKSDPDAAKFSDDQPRDEQGRFSSGGGAGTASTDNEAAVSGEQPQSGRGDAPHEGSAGPMTGADFLGGSGSKDVMPGVGAAGHVTSGGYWHPGRADNCSKPGCEESTKVAATENHTPDSTDTQRQRERAMAIETAKIAAAAATAAVEAALGKSAPEGVACPVCRNGKRNIAGGCPGCRGMGVIPLTMARTAKAVLTDRRDDVKAAALAVRKDADTADADVDDAIDDLLSSLGEVDDAQSADDADDKPSDDAVNAAVGGVGHAVSALVAAQAQDEAADTLSGKSATAETGKKGKGKKGGGLANFGDAKADPVGDKEDAKKGKPVSDSGGDDGDQGDNAEEDEEVGKTAEAAEAAKGTDGGPAKVDPPDSAGAKPAQDVGTRPGAGDTLKEDDDSEASADKDAVAETGKGKKKKQDGNLRPAKDTDTLDDNATPGAPPPAATLKPKAKKGGAMCKACKGGGEVDGEKCVKCGGKGFMPKKKKSAKLDKAPAAVASSPVARRVHDVLCPCYPTEMVKSAWNYDGLPTADVVNPLWFGDRLALLSEGTVKASPESVGEAYQAFAAANKLAALTPPVFESLRDAANKSFMNAYPSVSVVPALQNPEDIKRGFLSGTNKEESSTTRVPTPSLQPTFTARDFQRGPLTEDEARPTLTGGTSVAKGTLTKADDETPTPSPSRLFYRNTDKEGHASAMSLLHDHIVQHYPGICPMDAQVPGTEIDSDGQMGSPAEMNASGPSLPSLTSPAAAGTVGALTPAMTGDANKGAGDASFGPAEVEALVTEAVTKAVSEVEAKAAKRERKLRKQVKAAQRNEERLLRLPDRSKAPMRGQAFRVIPGEAQDTAETMKAKERTKTIEALKTKIADRNPAVAQRARDQLMLLATPEEFAEISVAADE